MTVVLIHKSCLHHWIEVVAETDSVVAMSEKHLITCKNPFPGHCLPF